MAKAKQSLGAKPAIQSLGAKPAIQYLGAAKAEVVAHQLYIFILSFLKVT